MTQHVLKPTRHRDGLASSVLYLVFILDPNMVILNWNIFKDNIFQACQKFIPTSSVVRQKSTPPWWTESLLELYKRKGHCILNTGQLRKSKIDYHNYASQCKLVKARVHSAQMIYEEQLIKKFKANSKAFYAYIKAK